MGADRIRLACRRGMWELDLLLENFFEKCYESLSEKDQALFRDLLACEDTPLFEWFTGQSQPDNQAFITLIQRIKNVYAQNASH